MNESTPLYNSHIIRIFIDYIRINYPDIHIREVLEDSGMTAEEIADTGHWFTQLQTDRFYETVVRKTGDPNIARKAGRYGASSEGLSLLKQYVSGLANTEIALLSLKKYYSLFARNTFLETKKIGPRRIEIISTPYEGTDEKLYQCENRLGLIEAVPMLFTNSYAEIEHTTCYHKGDSACRYIVSWQKSLSSLLRLVRNYTFLGSLITATASYFLLPKPNWLVTTGLLIVINLFMALIHSHQEAKELKYIIRFRHEQAEKQIDSTNARYNNSLLTQEIGQATSAILNINELMHKLAELMRRRLDFDRCLIMLSNEEQTRLVYYAGYGYSLNEKEYLKNTSFHLDKPESKGFFVKAFHNQKHIILSDAADVVDTLSDKSRRMIRDFNVHSLLCVPIIYKTNSLGILAVDNVHSKAPLKKSDINLLEGIASQIAISINNAIIFQKLQESEIKYRQTLESIAEGYYEIDMNKKVKFANNALCKLFGYAFQELMGCNFKEFFPQQHSDKIDRLFESIYVSRMPVHFSQFEIVAGEGNTIPVDLSASIILDHHGQPTGFRGILRNATDRLQLEKEKKQLETQLLQAQKMEAIGALAGGIAHNFNNWLAGILGNITLIRMDGNIEPKIRERAERVENIVENAAKMTQQLLGYARTGSYEAQLINLNIILKEAADTFAETKKEVTITLSLAEDLHKVKVDKSQIEQVFWNLFVNAIDAMPNGGNLHIATTNTSSDVLEGRPFDVLPGNYISIEFKDTGIGIEPQNIEQIFEPFFTTKAGKGTGLGLASSFGIIKAHKGYIDVSSKSGVGTTFKIFLPVQEESVAPAIKSEDDTTVHSGRGTILVVDDETIFLETSQQLLSRLGYEVLTAATGEEAMEKLRLNPSTVDLVIIDMIMPGMSGRELFIRIKELKPDMKTLLCSGYSMNKNAQEIMIQGCDGFIQKPFNYNQLSLTIKKIMQ